MDLKPIDKVKAQLVIVTGLLLIGLIFDWFYVQLAAAILGVGFVFVPPFGNLVLKGWFKIAEGLGWFNSRILLSFVFYVFLTPLAVAFRLFGNDPLKLNGPPEKSVFDERDHTYTASDLENPW
ncbi:MAG: SxtJ family membrane protein [Balneolaceae bacterium]